jgi:3-hydroxyacyl-CoA dehydrogenase
MVQVAVIGSGLIGRAWAVSFARAGHAVALWDHVEGVADGAMEPIRQTLDELDRNDLLDGRSPGEVAASIRAVKTIEDALAGAAHVQENTTEDVATKQAVFARLDAKAPPEAVIASSTSAILPSRFTEALAGRARCLVAHPINPPHLIPAVELVPAPWTSPETVERTRRFMLEAGHAPIVMARELDAFIVNRLQGALLEEAFRLVADGYADPGSVDAAVRDGLALRWSFMGPFETIDLNAPDGVADYVRRYQGMYANIFPQMQRRVDWAGPVLETVETARRARVPKDKLGERAAWRDRRLMALIAHKRKAERDIGK